ncbi:MAG TPA: hypothetical protein VK978_00865 [Candidatus Saccharimonadales bacterium]|nr:hypothetical protein [Candidatus Saccharimonadales bacterium]
MRRVVDTDLKRRNLDYRKVMATIISIMDLTYIRVGNEAYAKDTNSYGLTTLRSKRTTVSGAALTFEFKGKSGQHHIKKITDRSLARIVHQLDDLLGYEVFKYYGDDGKLHDVKSYNVNAYIHGRRRLCIWPVLFVDFAPTADKANLILTFLDLCGQFFGFGVHHVRKFRQCLVKPINPFVFIIYLVEFGHLLVSQLFRYGVADTELQLIHRQVNQFLGLFAGGLNALFLEPLFVDHYIHC